MTKRSDTLVVQILNTQYATWQGTVTWSDGKKQPFRSALELIRLIDSAIPHSDGDRQPSVPS